MRYTVAIVGEEKRLHPDTEADVEQEVLDRFPDVVMNHGPMVVHERARKLMQDRLFWLDGKIVARATAETDGTLEFVQLRARGALWSVDG